MVKGLKSERLNRVLLIWQSQKEYERHFDTSTKLSVSLCSMTAELEPQSKRGNCKLANAKRIKKTEANA